MMPEHAENSIHRPRIMIAAAHSGAGKTSVSTALTAALRRRGQKVATFKTGPDFLDPTYLTAASGTPCTNLDTWMMGDAHVARLLSANSRHADISVIEGAMGLFDGAAPDSIEGSSAEIAALTRTPVLLIVDARGMSGSIAALVAGFAGFEARVRVAGVIANHVGSPGHGELLSRALRAAGLPELAGAIPRDAFPKLPSRHLGLVTADSRILDVKTLDALADAMERHVDVDKIVAMAKSAPDLNDPPLIDAGYAPGEKIRLAVAKDEAFHFYYPDTLAAFEAAGFDIVPFSPLADDAIPPSVAGAYLGGGYPEVFAEALSGNRSMIDAIRSAAASGMPVYAECGGLMYLSRAIVDAGGSSRRMCGLLPFATRMLTRRASLGYVEVTLSADCLWGKKGTVVRGHEFHYSQIENDPGGADDVERVYHVKRRWNGSTPAEEGYRAGSVLASYVHLHLASRPGTIKAFYDACAQWRSSRRTA